MSVVEVFVHNTFCGFKNTFIITLVAFVTLKIICTGLRFKKDSVYVANLSTFGVKKWHLQNPVSLAWIQLLASLKSVKH